MCQRIRDPLFSRALVLGHGTRRIALVSVDLLLITRPLREAVMKRLSAEGPVPDGVVLCATHTHSGPGGYWDVPSAVPFMGRYRKEIFHGLAEGIAASIRGAMRDTAAASLSWGEAATREGTNFNRRNRRLPVDPTLSVLALRRGTQTIRAVFFGAHPVVVAEHEAETASACFPGEITRVLESGEDRALFFNGMAGGTSILWKSEEGLERHLQQIVSRLREEVQRAEAEAASLPEGPVRHAEVPVPITIQRPKIFPEALSPLETLFLPLRSKLKRFGEGGIDSHDGNTVVNLLRLGDLLVAGCPADTGPGVGLAVRKRIRERGFRDLAVLSYCGDYVGYVHMPGDYRAFPEWSLDGFFLTLYENAMGFGGRKMGAAFLDAVDKGMNSIAGGE